LEDAGIVVITGIRVKETGRRKFFHCFFSAGNTTCLFPPFPSVMGKSPEGLTAQLEPWSGHG
jgi:hypothetical protein